MVKEPTPSKFKVILSSEREVEFIKPASSTISRIREEEEEEELLLDVVEDVVESLRAKEALALVEEEFGDGLEEQIPIVPAIPDMQVLGEIEGFLEKMDEKEDTEQLIQNMEEITKSIGDLVEKNSKPDSIVNEKIAILQEAISLAQKTLMDINKDIEEMNKQKMSPEEEKGSEPPEVNCPYCWDEYRSETCVEGKSNSIYVVKLPELTAPFKDLEDRILTIVGASLPDKEQRDAVKKLIREEFAKSVLSLRKFEYYPEWKKSF